MRRRYWFQGLAVVLSSGLLAGCGSVTVPRQQAPAAIADPTPRRPPPAEPPGDQIAVAHAHYAAGVIHEMNDELEAALQDYYQAALADPDNEGLVLDVSRRFLQNKQPEKALEFLKRAVARPNASGALYARLGLIYSQLGKSDEAAAADRAAIKRAPESLIGYHNLFFNCLQNKLEQEALKVLDEAARQPKVGAEFLIGLAELYGNFTAQFPSQKERVKPKALAVLRRADKLKPAGPMLRIRLADALNSLGDYERAAQLYLELLQKLPDAPLLRERVHAKLADIYLHGNDPKKAVEQLEAVLREDPTNPLAYYYLGYLAYEDKQPAKAAEYFNKTILLRPEFEAAYYDLALAQISLDKPSEALATLAKAREKFPQNFLLEFWTGLAYSRQKAYAQAIAHYTAAEVIAKATAPERLTRDLYYQLGSACERNGDLPQAEKAFQQCLRLAPDFPEALNYLGYMWAEHGMKLEQARELIQKAVKAEPQNGAYLDSLGWVLFKLNQPEEALQHILKAVELTKEPDPTLFDHLGDIYLALNEPAKAREAYTRSLSLEKNDAIQKKLDTLPSPTGPKPANP